MRNKNFNAIIGTDCSLAECVESGYMMMLYNSTKSLETQEFEFVQLDNLDCRNWQRKNNIRNYKRTATFDKAELLEMYERHKQSYDRFADNLPALKFDHIYDFLLLADSMQAYNGVIFE